MAHRERERESEKENTQRKRHRHRETVRNGGISFSKIAVNKIMLLKRGGRWEKSKTEGCNRKRGWQKFSVYLSIFIMCLRKSMTLSITFILFKYFSFTFLCYFMLFFYVIKKLFSEFFVMNFFYCSSWFLIYKFKFCWYFDI